MNRFYPPASASIARYVASLAPEYAVIHGTAFACPYCAAEVQLVGPHMLQTTGAVLHTCPDAVAIRQGRRYAAGVHDLSPAEWPAHKCRAYQAPPVPGCPDSADPCTDAVTCRDLCGNDPTTSRPPEDADGQTR